MKVMVTGHRPNKLGGYDENNPIRVALKDVMRERLAALSPEEAMCGMALGIDQDFGWLCVELGVPFIAAVPFEGQETTWPAASQKRYHELLAHAKEVVYVSDPGYSNEKMHDRNHYMVNWVGEDGVVMAIWDGSSGGTGSCVTYAKKRKRKIDLIDPDVVASGL